jgi:hypothetical protein
MKTILKSLQQRWDEAIKEAPDCDERCPFCLNHDKWKCVNASPIEGSSEHEIEYQYECQAQLVYETKSIGEPDFEKCSCKITKTYGD